MIFIPNKLAWLCLVASFPFFLQAQSPVAEGAQLQKLGTNYGVLQSPVADPAGNVFFTDYNTKRIYKWTLNGKIVRVKGGFLGCKGLAFDRKGNLVLCETKGGRKLSLVNPKTGDSEALLREFEGKRFNSPEDLWIHQNNGLYFTDGRHGDKVGLQMKGEYVFYMDPNRDSVVAVITDLAQPSGIMGSVKQKLLYVSDYEKGQTYVYKINADGSLSNRRVFADIGASGIAIDDKKNVYLARDKVYVYNSRGKLIHTIAVPEKATHVAFGGAHQKTLFITAQKSLYALEMKYRRQQYR
ncbi:MAG: SMP-30/gluconolactonase/LRE family protein [Bacteroidota bacterium]